MRGRLLDGWRTTEREVLVMWGRSICDISYVEMGAQRETRDEEVDDEGCGIMKRKGRRMSMNQEEDWAEGPDVEEDEDGG